MASIIEQIIEIDAAAQKRLQAAMAVKDLAQKEADQKAAEVSDVLAEKTRQRIAKMRETEQAFAQQQIDAVEEETKQQMLALETLYAQKHTALEQELLGRILSSEQ